MEREIKTGMRAVWDSFAGLVPVRIDAITGATGAPSSASQVYFTVTRDHGPYKKGEKFDVWSLHVVPRNALIRRKYSTRIGFYMVHADKGQS